MSNAAGVVARLAAAGLSVGTVESLTAGLVAATLADVPGASDVLRGGLVTYATELKVQLAGVPADTAARGVVTEETALAMARGGREKLGVDWCCATTGIAGPGPYDGIAAGTVWIAVAGPAAATAQLREFGDIGRAEVRRASVAAVLALLNQVLDLSE